MSDNMETDDNAVVTVRIPAGVRCHYAVTVNAETLQHVKLIDSQGDVVFTASGKGAGAFSHQIAAGAFMPAALPGEEVFRLSISHFDKTDRRFRPSAILQTSDAVAAEGFPVFCGLDYVASDNGRFAEAVNCVVRLFYLPQRPPRPASIVDVFVLADTQTILTECPQPSQNADDPTPLPPPCDEPYKYVFMVTRDNDAICGQATGNLTIRTNIGDKIRWRSGSLSDNASQCAVIYKIEKIGDGDSVLKLPPTAVVACREVPIPNEEDPLDYTQSPSPDYYVSAKVRRHGMENYKVSFYIVDIVDGQLKTLGYFSWSPAVIVDLPV